MARRVGVLGPERRAKGIYVAECHCVGFGIELAAYGQVGCLIKEVLAKIHLAVLCLGDVVQVQGGYLEHFPGALTVTACYQRCVHIYKIPFLEILMDGIRNQGAHTEYCLEGIGPWTQMGNRAQILKGVAFFLKRVIGSRGAFHGHFCGLYLKGLFGLGRGHQGSLCDDGSTHIHLGNLCKIRKAVVIHNLKRFKITSVTYHNKAKGFGIPQTADPPSNAYFLVQIVLRMLIKFSYGNQIHD